MPSPSANSDFRRFAIICLCALLLTSPSSLMPALRAGDPSKVKTALAVPAEELALTLRRSIEMALAKNYSIRVSSYDPLIAKSNVRGAIGSVFDPVVTARAQLSQNNNPVLVTPDNSDTGSTRSTNETLNANVRETLPFGAILSAETTTTRLSGSGSGQYSSFTGITATQPLLQGFGTDATLTPIRLARKDQQTSEWGFRQIVTDIITETAQAYDDLYFARENLRVVERSRDLAQRLLNDNTQRVKLGVLTPLDISVARSQLAAREESIITARQTVRESENALKLRVTDNIERFLSIRLKITPPEERKPGKLNFNEDLPHAFSNRPDYQQALIDLQRRQINLVFDRNQAQPRLDLSASFGSNGLSRSLADSLSQSYSGSNVAAQVAFDLTLPIPNRAGRSRVESGRLDIAKTLLSLKQLEQQIIVRLDNAASAVRSDEARIAASAEALRLAQETLDAEEKKLSEGISTTYVVLQLQNDQATAESNALRAKTDYQKSLVEYEREAGRTLQVNQVEFEQP